MLAAGVAFYAMLALVPALGAAVSMYGLVVSRAQVDRQITSLATTLPPEARQLVRAQLQTVTSSSSGGLGSRWRWACRWRCGVRRAACVGS